jgi:hypothetical protein
MDTRDELRDELIAVMNAHRELGDEDPGLLADVFLNRVQKEREGRSSLSAWRQRVLSVTPVAVGGTLATVTAVVLLIGLVGMVQERASQMYLDPAALPPVYWLALVITVCVAIACGWVSRRGAIENRRRKLLA